MLSDNPLVMLSASPIVMLNAVKHLVFHRYHEILRFAQNDKKTPC